MHKIIHYLFEQVIWDSDQVIASQNRVTESHVEVDSAVRYDVSGIRWPMNRSGWSDDTRNVIQRGDSSLLGSGWLEGYPGDRKSVTSAKTMGDDFFTNKIELPHQQFSIDRKWFFGWSNMTCHHVNKIKIEAIKGGEELVFNELQPHSKLLVLHLYSLFFILSSCISNLYKRFLHIWHVIEEEKDSVYRSWM